MEPSIRILVGISLFRFLVGAAADTDGVIGRTRCTRVFSFGDSLVDTGNLVRLPAGHGVPESQPPYGETYFHRPTGRASDGRLAIDFIAEALKVPHLRPYLAGGSAAEFQHGANFAVGGSTAHDAEFFEARGIARAVPVSLKTELGWFKKLLHLLGNSAQDQRNITASSFFFVGEMGGNDYFLALSQNRTLDEIKTFVPGIIDIIHSSLRELLRAGATMMVVNGMLPFGCEPWLLEQFKHGRRAGDYDAESGCLISLNELAEQHNRKLNCALDELRQAHPDAAIVYADYYNAVTDIIVSPRRYGFGDSPLFACCGVGGGPYNVNLTAGCSKEGSTACSDPSEYISWDGVHYTEAASRVIARGILEGPYAIPPILAMCQ